MKFCVDVCENKTRILQGFKRHTSVIVYKMIIFLEFWGFSCVRRPLNLRHRICLKTCHMHEYTWYYMVTKKLNYFWNSLRNFNLKSFLAVSNFVLLKPFKLVAWVIALIYFLLKFPGIFLSIPQRDRVRWPLPFRRPTSQDRCEHAVRELGLRALRRSVVRLHSPPDSKVSG